MIHKMSFRNFKCLRDVTIDLERFTVCVGPNASGKSSILKGMHFLCQIFGFPQVTTQHNELLQFASRGVRDNIDLAAGTGGQWYRVRAHPSPPQVQQNIRNPPWSGLGLGVAPDLNSTEWKLWQFQSGVMAPLPSSVLLRLEASKLVVPNPSPADPTVMLPDGTGLHTALASMALNDPDSWQHLQADLRRIIPTIRRLRHTKTVINQPSALQFDTVGADSLPASEVSEGTLLILGLLAALYAPNRPNLILLDDLDRGLHPKAQKELIVLLRGLQQTNANLQIVATTHSPYLLDSMQTNEVRMTFLKDDGSAMCAALTEHPRYEKWKDEMGPGEMWSLFGEKWLVEKGVAG